ncbi:MAG: hypothetical protein M9900_05450 [Flavobacteriales bacterium]|nr:hypothetical protein [Flavobacteriales bacterium]HRO39495.1 hypothetical protein [Flavobacteriales bacterium]HRP81291.1 hypothetical protein [Flavobacteriales bacterium]
MRHLPIWVSLFLLAGPLRAQHPHLDLPPMGSAKRVQLVGQVTDSLSGKPVYDCLVGYYDREGQRRSITPVNSDGRYAMFIPATEPFELRVERENGYVEMHRKGPAIPLGTPQYRMDLVLRPK